MQNSLIMQIYPYRHRGIWVFDDAQIGFSQEPFVGGAPEIIDILVRDIPTVDEGFRLLFSDTPFLGYQAELIWMRTEYSGQWYCWIENRIESWFCPSLLGYFDRPPNRIYCKAESLYF